VGAGAGVVAASPGAQRLRMVAGLTVGRLVSAGQFSEIYGQPHVVGELVELDLAKESHRDGRGCESPRVGITAEFEAGQKKPDADAGLRAGDQGELWEGVRGTGSRHCDPDETTLGTCRRDLASHAGNRDLGGGRFPLRAGREPRDGFFVRLDLGGRGLDPTAVDDLFEPGASGVVVDDVGRIGAGRWLVGA
jgi:hypothetical protein